MITSDKVYKNLEIKRGIEKMIFLWEMIPIVHQKVVLKL